MDDQLGLFIERDELVILVDDGERDVLRQRLIGGDFREGDFEDVAGPELGGTFGGVAIDDDGARFDELLQHRPRIVGQAIPQVQVDPLLQVVLDLEVNLLQRRFFVRGNLRGSVDGPLWRLGKRCRRGGFLHPPGGPCDPRKGGAGLAGGGFHVVILAEMTGRHDPLPLERGRTREYRAVEGPQEAPL